MRRPQFSLKTLLWLMGSILLLAAVIAAFAWVREFEREMGEGYERLNREREGT
jgi:hypothetical protein